MNTIFLINNFDMNNLKIVVPSMMVIFDSFKNEITKKGRKYN